MEIADKEEVRNLLKGKTPIVIFFYMDGCGHCEKTKEPWNKLTSMGLPYKFIKVESANVPEELEIGGFPHFMARDSDGKETTADGAKESPDEIESSLKLGKKKSGGRRKKGSARHGARRLTRRIRKRAYRTRRRHVPL